MKNLPLLIGTIAITLLMVVGIAWFFSSAAQKPFDATLVAGDKRNHKGNSSAKITVVECSDFKCPACRAASKLLPDLLQRYPDQVEVVYRNYPLSQIHPNAQVAAQAAEAAGEMGQFWPMHDLLFEKQLEWESLDKAAFLEQLGKYAEELQIDKSDFLARIQLESVKQKVAADVKDGTALNIDGTPTFFVNGKKTAAPQLISTVESLLKSSE
jgi:protein-disulfide isomerase